MTNTAPRQVRRLPRGLLFTRATLAYVLGALGRYTDAFGPLREAMHIAEEAGHVFTLLVALFALGTLKLDQGEFAEAVAPLERGLDLCRTKEISIVLDDFVGALGAAYHSTGRGAEAIALMEGAARSAAARSVGFALGWPGRVASLSAAYVVKGRVADATSLTEAWLATAQRRGQRGVEGHLLRSLGDIAAHPDRFDPNTAEARYREALAIAEDLGLRPLQAHCHLALGALYRRTGEGPAAKERLATAATMYREMDMPFWLYRAATEQEALP